jgi:hypothetical protein
MTGPGVRHAGARDHAGVAAGQGQARPLQAVDAVGVEVRDHDAAVDAHRSGAARRVEPQGRALVSVSWVVAVAAFALPSTNVPPVAA